MKLYEKKVTGWKQLIILVKSSILDIWLGSE